jgi:hypothetical protein
MIYRKPCAIRKIVAALLLMTFTVGFSSYAAAGSFIEVEGRFIKIFGKTFCLYGCDELKPPPPVVRQPAIIPPLPR